MRRLLWKCTYSGLCNRLVYVVSSKAIAELSGTEWICDWKPNYECDAEWEELFRTDGWFDHLPTPVARGEPIAAGKVWFSRFYRVYLKDVCSWEDFRLVVLKYLKALQPIDEIQRRVRNCLRGDGEYVAVHIRMTDNKRCFRGRKRTFAERFPRLGDFLEIISREVESGVRVFVATDNRTVQQEIEHMYGEAVFFLEKPWRTRVCFVPRRNLRIGDMLQMKRTTRIAVALADLLVLSASKGLYGTYYSTYSKLAAVIGGITDFRMATRGGTMRSKDVDMMILNGDPLDGDDES